MNSYIVSVFLKFPIVFQIIKIINILIKIKKEKGKTKILKNLTKKKKILKYFASKINQS